MLYKYEHTQPGTWIRFALATPIGIGAALVFLGQTTEIPVLGKTLLYIGLGKIVVFAGVLILFHNLTVRVSSNDITVHFGVGLIGKSFMISEIQSAEAVRNRWFWGWGIRWTPYGWIYNINGLDAIEIELGNGKRYRIGTNEPLTLLAAVKSVLDGSDT